ncbi:MAG: IMP dehydrogenase [Desulfovibrionaceae bacterium]|nr:IMP dehydrogenase [Desulfovibrionaceae bacterium]
MRFGRVGVPSFQFSDFFVECDEARCTRCRACERQCSYGVHAWDEAARRMTRDSRLCVGCHRCAALCPAHCLSIRRPDPGFRPNALWTPEILRAIGRQAESGGVLLSGAGSPVPKPSYWDRLLLDASQVTNPPMDPLREPMELRTVLGARPDRLEAGPEGRIRSLDSPVLVSEYPILFAAMSFGAISYNIHEGMARAAAELGIYANTGEGGLHPDLYAYGDRIIVQVASGRFGVHRDYLRAGAAMEIKIGQGAKPGIGGHLPGAKIDAEVSRTRMIPEGSDALSPAPHHDIYSIEDLLQLIRTLKEATEDSKPVSVKVAAVHNIAAIVSGIVRAGADMVVIDGFRGGTGAAPAMIRDNVGIPIELALAAADNRLREEGIRHRASIVASGGIRCSADALKAIALGADAVAIGSAALIACGCTLCGHCYTGKCPWGIATNQPELKKRQKPAEVARRLVNLVRAWGHEMEEMLGGMGLNAIEGLRGNRDKLRGVGLSRLELDILGVKHAGL